VLLYGLVCVILCLAVLAQYRYVTYGRTDGHMTAVYTTIA